MRVLAPHLLRQYVSGSNEQPTYCAQHSWCHERFDAHGGALLDIDPRRAEQVASRMIADGRLAAKLDQVDGVLHFADDAPPLARFDDSIAKICLAVNACYDKISALSDEATSAATA